MSRSQQMTNDPETLLKLMNAKLARDLEGERILQEEREKQEERERQQRQAEAQQRQAEAQQRQDEALAYQKREEAEKAANAAIDEELRAPFFRQPGGKKNYATKKRFSSRKIKSRHKHRVFHAKVKNSRRKSSSNKNKN